MSKEAGKSSLPLPMLPGDSAAAFYPLCGIAIYPPPPIPPEVAAHEIEHSLAASTVVMHFLRALAESVHSGISLFATWGYMKGTCPTPIVVPGFRQPYGLGIRNRLLIEVGALTALPEEVCGLTASMQMLRIQVAEGALKISDTALHDYEEKLISFYASRIRGFRETYSAMKEIDDEQHIVSALLKRYALNCKVSDLLDISIFDSPMRFGESHGRDPEQLRIREIERALERIRQDQWESPARRFQQAIDVIKDIRKHGIQINSTNAEAAIPLIFKDFEDSVKRGALDPRGSHMPDFRLVDHPGNPPRDLQSLSVRFWEEAGGVLQEEKPVYSQSVFREGGEAREAGPLLCLTKVAQKQALRVDSATSKEDRDLCMRLFMAEFWREQLTVGNGLTCPFDVLADQELAHSSIQERPGHLRSMWGIWNATIFDPALSHLIGEVYRWDPPSCLGLGAELRIAQKDILWSE